MSHGESPAGSCQDLKLLLCSKVHRVAVLPPDLSAWLSPLFCSQNCSSVLVLCFSFKKCKKFFLQKARSEHLAAQNFSQFLPVLAVVFSTDCILPAETFFCSPVRDCFIRIKLWLNPILPGSDPVLGATETIDCLLPRIIIDAVCQS